MGIADGFRVSGITGEEIAAQVVWRATGPLEWSADRRSAALSWLGLSGPAPVSATDVGRRLGRSENTIRRWMAELVRVDVALTPRQADELSRPTLPGEDHLARARRARLLGVPEPVRVRPTALWKEWSRPAVRIVDAVGPVTTAQLTAGIAEFRAAWAPRHRLPESYEELPVALEVIGDLRITGGRWHRTKPSEPQFLDGQVVGALRAGPAVLTYPEYQQVLRVAGYTGTRTLPYVVHTARGRFTLVTNL